MNLKTINSAAMIYILPAPCKDFGDAGLSMWEVNSSNNQKGSKKLLRTNAQQLLIFSLLQPLL
jgi:hypothetical protein